MSPVRKRAFIRPISNTVRVRVGAAQGLSDPLTVVYTYASADGEKTHRRTLAPGEFRNGEAAYTAAAPGLVRCKSVSISY